MFWREAEQDLYLYLKSSWEAGVHTYIHSILYN